MADVHCYIAAFLFILGSVLEIVYISKYRAFGVFNGNNFDGYEKLNPEVLQLEWDFRLQNENLSLMSGLVNSLAWLFFTIPIFKVVWLQSGGGTRQVGTHVTIVVLAVSGSICELIARLISIGCTNALNWMASDFNLSNWVSETSGDEYGLRTLVMLDVALSGVMLWADAIECLFISAIFLLLFFSVRRTEEQDKLFGKTWACYGLLLSMFGIIQFASSVMRISNWQRYSGVAMGIGGLFRLALLPLWLVWLACQMPKAEDKASGGSGAKKDREQRHIMVDDSERSYT